MGEVSITLVDVVVVGVILVSAFFAMWRGLVRETFSIFEWVAAAYASLRFYPVFRPLLTNLISPPWLESTVVFVGIFLMVLIPLSFLSLRLSETVKKSEIGPVDRTLGFVFGVGRGLVIVGLGYIAFASLVPLRDHPQMLTNARTFPLIRNTSEVLLGLLPDENGLAEFSSRSVAQKPAPSPKISRAAAKPSKTYGANDRRALDRLIEATGDGKDSR